MASLLDRHQEWVWMDPNTAADKSKQLPHSFWMPLRTNEKPWLGKTNGSSPVSRAASLYDDDSQLTLTFTVPFFFPLFTPCHSLIPLMLWGHTVQRGESINKYA